ncbi:MAG: electron transport complex protein RnfC [Candidatus Eisenbacteria bacterium]|nr:electron transport complex protein RnfC [Candidatus Eisenbacteria bacterium]
MAASLAKAIEKGGVVGAGGGGFPSHVKAESEADIFIANGAECEPLLAADSELMRLAPDRVVRGVELMRDAVGASRAVLAIKRKNEELMRSALPDGGSIELSVLENVYPAGDEYLLVFDTTGRVVPEGGIPTDVGVVVNNVTTLAQVADAADGRPVTTRMVTVQGAVESPGTFLTPLGTPIRELLALAGWKQDDGGAVIAGGPMMGCLASDLDQPTTKPVGGLLALPGDHVLVTSRTATEEQVLRVARAACCQCMACTELCPRWLLGHDLEPHRTVRAIQYDTIGLDDAHITSAYLCCECGMCELFACPLEIRPRRIMASLKAELVRRGVPNPHSRSDIEASDVREYRQIPTSRLVARLGLSDYDRAAPLSDRRPEPHSVRLLLRQHVGEPAEPVVEEGSRVVEGDLVAEIPEGRLGARVHASITGVVSSVTPDSVIIERRGG